MELGIRFALWAESLRTDLTAERVIGHFGVSRATAYRMIQRYRDAKGIPPLRATA